MQFDYWNSIPPNKYGAANEILKSNTPKLIPHSGDANIGEYVPLSARSCFCEIVYVWGVKSVASTINHASMNPS